MLADLLVGTHCGQCRDEEEVMEKKKNIEEKVKPGHVGKQEDCF